VERRGQRADRRGDRGERQLDVLRGPIAWMVGAVVPAPTAHRERKAMRMAESGIIEIEVNGSALFGRLLSDT
jgi:hypothetical protein